MVQSCRHATSMLHHGRIGISGAHGECKGSAGCSETLAQLPHQTGAFLLCILAQFDLCLEHGGLMSAATLHAIRRNTGQDKGF